MKNWSKHIIRKILWTFGFEVYKIPTSTSTHNNEPVHGFDHTFQRLRALHGLGFYPITICDIGASNGCWSRRCLEIFPQARYFCVDPLTENQPYLAQLSTEYSNVTYWQGCLGRKSFIATLNADGVGSSILLGHWGNPYGIQKEVTVETLDNLILQGICPQPDLIKLDVQGYELEVLKGSINALRKTQAIIAEVSFFPFQKGMPLFHEVVGQLAEYGFVVSDILSLSLRPLDGVTAQSDLLFLQATHPLRKNNKWDHDSIY